MEDKIIQLDYDPKKWRELGKYMRNSRTVGDFNILQSCDYVQIYCSNGNCKPLRVYAEKMGLIDSAKALEGAQDYRKTFIMSHPTGIDRQLIFEIEGGCAFIVLMED